MQFLKEYKEIADLNNCPYDTIVDTGGRGSGKTQHNIRSILIAMVQKKKRVCFFRETKGTVASSLMAETQGIIEADFDGMGFYSTKTEITNINGSQIFYKGLKEVNLAAIENLKGIASSTDIFFIDEGQTISKAVWDVLIPTLRKAGSILIVAYNRIADNLPLEEALFLEYGKIDNTKIPHGKEKYFKAPEGTLYMEVNYPILEEKGLLSKRFLNRANLVKTNRPKEYNAIYLNQAPDVSDRAICKNFSDKNIRPLFYQEKSDLHITCDFNVDPMCWAFFHKTQDYIYYFDELAWENTTTQMCAQEVIRRFPNHKGEIILNGDASGDFKNVAQKNPDITNFTLIKEILERYYQKEVRIEIRRGNPKKLVRFNAFNERLCDIYGKERLYFDPKCKWIIYNLKNCMYKIGTTEPEEPTQNDIKAQPDKKFLFHMLDAISYPVELYYPIA